MVHGHLIDLLLKALLGIEDDPKEDQENENVMGRKAPGLRSCVTLQSGDLLHSELCHGAREPAEGWQCGGLFEPFVP